MPGGATGRSKWRCEVKRKKSLFRDLPAVGGKNRPEGRQQRVYVWITGKDGIVRFRRAW